ncbi:hypothetical protein A3K79_03385 [Candidatus Bathyarchaeota archaeon RBG_13_46_16b]|nr:MAG: hypothetical protein A3K79_03385 [Candidatus Bathyarchaeota archaeon RBG_13_46_16b]
MSHKVKREISSMSFTMNKLYRRISNIRPSAMILSILAMSFAVFLFGGGLYDIIVKPYAAVYYGGRFIFLYPDLSMQFISDSIEAMMLFTLGVIGLVAVYQSTKYAYKPRQAYMLFLVGVVLLFLTYILLEATVQLKISGG